MGSSASTGLQDQHSNGERREQSQDQDRYEGCLEQHANRRQYEQSTSARPQDANRNMGRWQQHKNAEVQLPDASSMPTSRMNASGPQEASSATRYQQINETTRRQRTHVLSRSQELRKSLRTEAGHARMSWQREIREAEGFLRADRRLETIV